MDEVLRWYRGIPVCTRLIVTSIFLTTLAGNYRLISPGLLVWNGRLCVAKLQFWRCITAFTFFGRFSFHFLLTTFLFYKYSVDLERTAFLGRTADYITFLGFSATGLLLAGSLLNSLLLGESLLMTLVYLWSQQNRDAIVTFMFGIRCKGVYFPWILLAYHLLTGHTPILELVGVLVGHLYYYLEYIYPAKTGRRWIRTPEILYHYYPKRTPDRMMFSGSSTVSNVGRTSSTGLGSTKTPSSQSPFRTYFSGSGRRLGSR